MDKDIYAMKLHEQITLGYGWAQVTRVASGWIYQMPTYNAYPGGAVFVPFDNKFQQPQEQP